MEQKAAELDPVLIYFDAGDAEHADRAIAEQRGPAWTDYMIPWSPNAPARWPAVVQGMDGAVAIMRAYKDLLDESVERFLFPKFILSDCHRRWTDCHARILECLELHLSPHVA